MLDQLNRNTPAWWESRGNGHFQQGLTEFGSSGDDRLAGTAQEDYLIGGDGADFFYPGPGNDGVNGGADDDVVLFSGNYSDYTVTAEGNGYRVAGPDGSDYVYEVEVLQFIDSQVIL